ncbi:MAG: hypothetical protein A3I68_00580 [Candidatus Melainabacteria bacterium RIFCSPLOWO2_02_FULL_35_15]|nr:MAG: hypothetical protein A3F80_05060 [Candidatus Melainabacteria bacterium RIFCSPLOWO2_12_FULL_35_11]OGI14346.1 MAG: hypothetical protein A3I68_00580 [Candidatus Melainabacteria bacterium RIFCSPLOWO2_02_FULL_35_15]
MKKIIALALALVLLAPVALAEENSFENLVLDIIKKNPQIIKDALEKYEKEAVEKKQEDEFNKLFEDKVQIEIGESPVKGDKKAEYTIVTFSDFQCPFCKRGDDTIKELMKKYDKKIKYVFKSFPLGFHPEAAPAAKAAWAADKQGKFFEYHDKLFENQGKLGEDLYVQIAKDLNLNLDKFNKDRASEDAAKSIQADTKQGQEVGIQGTPGFILNGIRILGAYPIDHFEKIISKLETTAKK